MLDLWRKFQSHPRAATILGLVLAFVIAVSDQASKAWILYGLNLPLHQQVEVLPFFSLTMVRNIGISYGFFSSGGPMRWVLAVFQLSASVALIVWMLRSFSTRLNIALGLIAGGALGNAIDRVRLGYVVDFLDFSKIHFKWVFNVADAAITVGVILMLYHFYLAKPDDAPDSAPVRSETK
jgi:signal peptidase II